MGPAVFGLRALLLGEVLGMSFTRTLRAVGGAVVAGALLFGSAPTALADQIRDDQWPLKSFDAENMWKVSTGKGVTVAVIDAAVNGDHPDLKGTFSRKEHRRRRGRQSRRSRRITAQPWRPSLLAMGMAPVIQTE